MTLRCWLCNLLECESCYEHQDIDSHIDPPMYLEDIDKSEIYTIIRAEFPDASFIFTDRDYKTTIRAEYERFLRFDDTDKMRYIADYVDCDDFCFALYGAISNQDWGGLSFGYVFTKTTGGAHAVNFFIDKNRNVLIVEPQDDRIFSLPDNWEPYFVLI